MRSVAVPASLVTAAALIGAARPASACTPLPPGVLQREPLPMVGATEVPINARVTVRYLSNQVALAPAPVLRDEAGAEVAVDVETVVEGLVTLVVLTPRQPLAFSSRYGVFDTIQLESDCPATGTSPCTGDPIEISYFQTGGAADTMAPISVGATVATDYTSAETNLCGPVAEVSHRGTVVGIVDEQPPVTIRYNLYDAQGRRFATLVPDIAVSHACPPGDGDVDSFTIRSVDIAGNEQTGGHTVSGQPCDAFERESGGSCSTGGDAGAVVGLLALAGLRRRRAR
jgi:MYXO-CTERM domain-containing protein